MPFPSGVSTNTPQLLQSPGSEIRCEISVSHSGAAEDSTVEGS